MNNTLKQDVKDISIELKKQKAELKEKQRTAPFAYETASLQSILPYRRREARLLHVLHALAKGKTYKQIEQHCKEGTELTLDDICSVAERYGLEGAELWK